MVDIAKSFKVTLKLEVREDGGLRVCSDDLPSLVLSHSDPQKVLADIPVVLTTILSEMLGGRIELTELHHLSEASTLSRPATADSRPARPRKLKFAATAAH